MAPGKMSVFSPLAEQRTSIAEPEGGHSASLLVNLARLDFVSLKLAVVCAQEGSLTRAAPLCNMALMTASRRLRILEETLGCTLFHRRCRSLELTMAGAYVIKTSQEVFCLIDNMMLEIAGVPVPYGSGHENPGRSTRPAS